jgi:hypothetical protein
MEPSDDIVREGEVRTNVMHSYVPDEGKIMPRLKFEA